MIDMIIRYPKLKNRNINALLDILKCRIIRNKPLKEEIIVNLDFIKGYNQFELKHKMKSLGNLPLLFLIRM